MKLLLIVGVVLVLLFLTVVMLYNGLVRARNAMRQARHGIEVALTQRHDLLTKQMQVVPAAVQAETAFQERMVELRQARPAQQMSVPQLEQADRAMDRAQSAVNVTAEAYPDFRSNQSFVELQQAITYVEEQLSAARRSFNGAVAQLDDRRQMFPSNIVAGMFGFGTEPMFRANEEQRADVDLSGLQNRLGGGWQR
ncbi:LemA family protein [Kytococcus sp. Marseille-QA3725]